MTPIDSTSAGFGVPDEPQRQLLRFLRGLRGLDAALGRWRPDYGGLPAQADPDPLGGTDVVEAHRLYADGLTFFDTHPGAARSLGEPSSGDIADALADARLRFGVNAIPLERLGVLTGQAAAPSRPLGGPTQPVRGGRGATTSGNGKGATPAKRSGGGGCALVAVIVAVLLIAGIAGGLIVAANSFLHGGPTAAAALPSTKGSPSASAAPSGAAPNVLAQANACTTIPAGSLPSGLSISSTSNGIGVDPDTGFSTPYVSIALGTTVGPTTPRLTLILVVLPFQDTPPSSGSPIDRAGTVQVIAYWDGSAWHKGLRTWSGQAWSISVDAAATQVDVVQNGKTVTLYDQVLNSGDSYGEILAASGGCSDKDLDSSLSPQQTYAG